jgi:hypothetical protein
VLVAVLGFSLIAADGFRVGAIDQLRTYADILDAPFFAAPIRRGSRRPARRDATHTGAGDTAGRAPSDPDSRDAVYRARADAIGAHASRAARHHAGERPHERSSTAMPPLSHRVWS